eukprot:m.539872 g.539872  ORF g.539872 m.539872 type:complete len:798 (+) comp57637_c0_seq2:165-2558(+)
MSGLVGEVLRQTRSHEGASVTPDARSVQSAPLSGALDAYHSRDHSITSTDHSDIEQEDLRSMFDKLHDDRTNTVDMEAVYRHLTVKSDSAHPFSGIAASATFKMQRPPTAKRFLTYTEFCDELRPRLEALSSKNHADAKALDMSVHDQLQLRHAQRVHRPRESREIDRSARESNSVAHLEHVAELEGRIRLLMQANKALETTLDVKRNEFHTQLNDVQDVAQATIDELEEKIAILSRDCSKYKAQVKSNQITQTSLESELAEAQTTISQLKRTLQLRPQTDSLPTAYVEDDTTQTEHSILLARNATQKQHIDGLQTQLAQLDSSYRKQLQQADESIRQLESQLVSERATDAGLAFLQEHNSELRQRVHDLSEQLSTLSFASNEGNMALELAAAETRGVHDRGSHSCDLDRDLEDKNKIIQALHRQVDVLIGEKENLTSELFATQEQHAHDIARLHKQYEDRQAQLVAQRALQTEYLAIIDKLKSPVLEMAATLQSLLVKNTRLGNDIQRILVQVEEKNETIEWLQTTLNQQESMYHELLGQTRQAPSQDCSCSKHDQRADETSLQFSEAQEQNIKLKGEIDELSTRILAASKKLGCKETADIWERIEFLVRISHHKDSVLKKKSKAIGNLRELVKSSESRYEHVVVFLLRVLDGTVDQSNDDWSRWRDFCLDFIDDVHSHPRGELWEDDFDAEFDFNWAMKGLSEPETMLTVSINSAMLSKAAKSADQAATVAAPLSSPPLSPIDWSILRTSPRLSAIPSVSAEIGSPPKELAPAVGKQPASQPLDPLFPPSLSADV